MVNSLGRPYRKEEGNGCWNSAIGSSGVTDIQRCVCGLHLGGVMQLCSAQRNLYGRVMRENWSTLVSLGEQPHLQPSAYGIHRASTIQTKCDL